MAKLKNILLAKLVTRFPKLLDRFVEKTPPIRVEGIPWAPLKKPIKDCRVALVTTAGVHLKTQKPFDMSDPLGDPSYRELPSDTPGELYAITHDYYDHTDADRDLNIVFPIDRLKELVKEGLIGSLAENNYGFMGHIDGRHIETLVKKIAPEVAGRLKAQSIDAVLLTPG
ncbi:MAG TPA: glycine/sarcosine/betaine reductase selenoprotein B family protein [Thermodesulfobacteriota bacterium]